MGSRAFIILKYGGSSVSSAANWARIAETVKLRLEEGYRPLVVCSALQGVTDDLERLLALCVGGEWREGFGELERRHRALAEALEIALPEEVRTLLERTEAWLLGASLVAEVTPRLRAQVLSIGELCASRLGHAYLAGKGLVGDEGGVGFCDMRACLISLAPDGARGGQGEEELYLRARVDTKPDLELQKFLAERSEAVLVTQGFIGRNPKGETVLLGRGGSDLSATLLGAKLGAERVELFTDVPGIFTAPPHEVPSARLIHRLDYREAQELASCGAEVLHPRCVLPAEENRLPIHIRSTADPGQRGTIIAPRGTSTDAQVKALATRRGIYLISMETLGMWRQAGFLAEAFQRFRAHQISVDLISSSESNVTVSIDPECLGSGGHDPGPPGSEPLGSGAPGSWPQGLGPLLQDLDQICTASLLGPCAALSLVGRDIRTILPQLGPALALFEEHPIYLMSQAANDLNLTFVIEERQAQPLLRRLHGLLFDESHLNQGAFGPSWETLSPKVKAQGPSAPPPPWWVEHREALLLLAKENTPLYVYNRSTLEEKAKTLAQISAVDRVFYAMKANSHPGLLRVLETQGLGFEAVSMPEILHLQKHLPELSPARILFSPNFAPRHEYEAAFALGIQVNIDSLYSLRAWPDLFAEREIFLRLDPGRGRGHHAHVRTAGPQSKFGIAPDEIDEALGLLEQGGAQVIGLHAHAGSGIRQAENWREMAAFLLRFAPRFGGLRILDLGGGLGVIEKPGQSPLDIDALAAHLGEVKAGWPGYELWLEPGRFLVAEAGVLLARVTQVKEKSGQRYIGLDAGMHTLIRPSLYGAYHLIVNLSRLEASSSQVAHIVGPICESGDTLGYGRHLPKTEEGDVFLIATAGAYGQSMSSTYNLRPRALECLYDTPSSSD